MVTRIGPKTPFRIYLAEWRDKINLTQEQLAARVETTKASISRWETGERDPPAKALAALAHALNCEIQDLFRDPAQPSADELLRGQPEALRKRAIKWVKDIIEEDKNKTGTDR